MAEQQPTTIPLWFNNTMKLVLRSPLHGLVSRQILVLTFAGRKSGKLYSTPVSYLRQGDTILLFTHARWSNNFIEPATVHLQIQGRDRCGTATAVHDVDAVAAGIDAHLRNNHFDAKFYGVTFDDAGNPNPAEIRRAAEQATMIRIQLD